jgi:membrane protease subunit HflK
MPWNEPGGNGKQNDPWGGNRKDQGPPDLDKIFGDMVKKIRALFGKSNNKGGSNWNSPPMKTETKYIVGLVAGALLAIWFISGIFIVNPAEETVILRLGQYSEVLQPGLHWFARFIDKKYTVDVQKIYSFALQGDFLTKSSDQGDLSSTLQEVSGTKAADIADQSKNLVNVELTVQYRISDPRAYLFGVIDPDETIKEVAAGALSDVVGQMKLDEVLTTGREMLSSGVMERVKLVLVPYNAGIEVMKVTLRKVQAPDQVRAAFNDVNRADQDKATSIQQALAYASKVVPLAQGAAARTLADATGYQKQVVLIAQANVAKYQALLKAYSSAPEVTRERMYLETMQTVFQNTSKVLVDVNSANNLIYLPLDKLMKQDLPAVAAKSDDAVKADESSKADSSPALSLNNINNFGQSLNQEGKNDTN